MVICGSVFFQRWTLKSQKFVCLLLLRCPAVSLPLHRTYQTWEILWFCLLRVRWEKYWKKNSRHTVWEQIDGHIRLLTFLPDIISCLQWGLILSFLQLQFQFVTCRPEILQPTILELRKLDLYFQSLSNIPGSYFKYLFFLYLYGVWKLLQGFLSIHYHQIFLSKAQEKERNHWTTHDLCEFENWQQSQSYLFNKLILLLQLYLGLFKVPLEKKSQY